MSFAPDTLGRDAFLGGRVQAWQPRGGYRSGIDAVLLAASVPAFPGHSVLELGCGAAVATLCLAARVPGLQLAGIEIQPAYAALARRNADEAGVGLTLFEADLSHPPAALRALDFDHVMMNPPYFDRQGGTPAQDEGRDVARGGEAAMAVWIDAAARRLRPGGVLSLIQRTERLPEVMAALDHRLGAVDLLPLLPRPGRDAGLFLLRARKGRKTPFRMRSPVTLHQDVRHSDAEGGYSEPIENALRHAHPLAGFDF